MLQVAEWKLGLRGEVLGPDAMARLLPEWQDLCDRSAEDNIYYSPRYAQALLEQVERHSNVRFAAVWDETTLVALLPFTRPKLAIPLLRPARQAWQSKYTFSCTPLLDEMRRDEAAAALLDVMASVSEAGWILPTLNTNGVVCRTISAALERRGLPWRITGRFERAILESGATFDEHVMLHVRPKRRNELRRNRRRLEELGRLEHETHRFGTGLDRAIAAFLDLEASGWKGRRGTALACNEDTRAFALRAFTGAEGESICRADVLTLDGKPIATSLIVFAGRTGFSVKSAYDEAYSPYGAGLLLRLEVTNSFLSEKWASRLDSATAGAHVVEGLWPGRTEVGDLVFCLSPRHPELRVSALAATERRRRSAKRVLRSVLERFRPS